MYEHWRQPGGAGVVCWHQNGLTLLLSGSYRAAPTVEYIRMQRGKKWSVGETSTEKETVEEGWGSEHTTKGKLSNLCLKQSTSSFSCRLKRQHRHLVAVVGIHFREELKSSDRLQM